MVVSAGRKSTKDMLRTKNLKKKKKNKVKIVVFYVH